MHHLFIANFLHLSSPHQAWNRTAVHGNSVEQRGVAYECVTRLSCALDNPDGDSIVIYLRHEVRDTITVKWHFSSERGQIRRRPMKLFTQRFPFCNLLGWRQSDEKAMQQMVCPSKR